MAVLTEIVFSCSGVFIMLTFREGTVTFSEAALDCALDRQ